MKADVAGKPVQAIEVAGCDTIPRLFHHRVAEWGARTAFREKRLGIWRATSWHEYGDRAKWVGLGLVSLGLRRGEVVSILAETKPEWLYADMGVIGVGGVSNGIYPTDSSRQVEYILNDSGSRFLLVENEEQLDKYLDVRERCPQLRKVIVFDLEGLAAYRDPQVLAFDELLALGRNYETDHPELWDELVNASAPEKLVLLVYTSGTTGPPKGAMLCHRNVLFLPPKMIENFIESGVGRASVGDEAERQMTRSQVDRAVAEVKEKAVSLEQIPALAERGRPWNQAHQRLLENRS